LEELSCHAIRTPNLHYLVYGSGRYSIGKVGLQNMKVLTRLILWKPSSLLSQGRSRARKGGARPKAPQWHKYNLLGVQGGVIDPSIHSSESRQHEEEAPEGSRRPPQVLELPRRCLKPCPSHHGWPCVVNPWWSSGAHALTPSRQLCILH
jgi:hypothetical protein